MQADELIPEVPEKFEVPSYSGSTEDARLALRDRAARSTFFMGKVVIGFKDLTVGCHGPMCRFIDSPITHKCGVAPRDHLKSSTWTIANSVKRVVQDPNIRILIGNETATNASHFLRRIQAIWERNVFFQWLFPEVIPDWSKKGKWSEFEMLIPRTVENPEATIEAIGVGGAAVSRHYDLIKLDDLVGLEASESPVVMQKTIDWYIYCESLKVHPVLSEIQYYGTRWAFYDVVAWIIENEVGVETFHRAALEGNNPLWPERFTLEALLRIKAKLGSFKFSCQYLNDPHDPTKSSFRLEWLKTYTQSGGMCIPHGAEGSAVDWHDMRRFMRIDPAISEEDEACEWAIVVDGVDRLGRKFLLEEWSAHCHPGVAIEKAFELWMKWEPDAFGIETVAFQKFLQFYFSQEMLRRGIHMNIVELKVSTQKSKTARMRSVQPYYERGEVLVQKSHRKFIEQYKQFPTGRDVDVLDAFSHGPQMWETPMADDMGEEEYEEDRELNRDYMFGGRDSLTGY